MSNILDVTEVLKASGWFESRKIDTTEIVKRYKEFGYEVFPAVLRFLDEFGNLNIGQHHTFPEKVLCECYNSGKFKAEERYSGEKLVLVGEAYDRYHFLFVSESGGIYTTAGKHGENAWEAWESLINNGKFKSWRTLQKENSVE